MNLKRLFLFLLLCLVGYTGLAYVTNQRVKFEKYSIGDGLSHLGVSSFCQDKKGFLWVGTYDGLNRFDGLNFKVYKHTPDDSTTLINNRVRCIFEHSSGRLFIGTEGGISEYDPEMETFTKFNYNTFKNLSGAVLKMFEDSEKRLWILTNKNVAYVVDFEHNDFQSIFLVPNDSRTSVFYNDILEDDQGLIWLATSFGLICYRKDLQRVELDMPSFLNSSLVRCIELDDDNNLWISLGATLRKLSRVQQENKIELSVATIFRLKSPVLSLTIDKKGNIWAGSAKEGIFRVVKTATGYGSIENYRYAPSSKESVCSNWISSIYEDRLGNIWFGTVEKGINKYTYNKEMFLNIDRSAGLCSNYVIDLCQYNHDIILCGTRSGISVFNLKTEQVEKPWFDVSSFNIEDTGVPAIYKDQHNALWIGTTTGLFYVKSESKITEIIPRRFSNMNIVGIIEDKFGNLWIGTADGLFRFTCDEAPEISRVLDFNQRTDNIVNNIRVSDFYIDPVDTSLWIGSWYNGLFHISISGKENKVDDFEIENYTFVPGNAGTLRSNFVSAVLHDKNGDLWVGTEGGGLSKLKRESETNSFVHYTEAEGLSNNVVKSILKDEAGRLYIGTNYKLNIFDPKSATFQYYDSNDGLKSDYFNRVALLLSNGEMAFGGNEGITIFDPGKMNMATPIPVPEFGDFQLSYKTVFPGEKIDGKVIIEKGLAATSEIHLDYHQHTFSIELLGISFDHPEVNLYRYRLTEYDQDWIYTKPANNMASYSNVPPGEYLFEFYVSNNKGEWSAHPKRLSIIISPPFWKTVWAYSLYIILLVGIVTTVFYILLNIERLKNNLRIEQLEKGKEKEVNDLKLRFFTNISHEFKTPVSLILGPTETLIKKFRENDGVKRNLYMIHEQANYLLRLLDQLLEFRKVETESVKLKCTEKDIVAFVKHLYRGFDTKAIEKKIKYDFYAEEQQIKLWFDPSKVEMIVYNLLSNAFKFTQPGGTITVFVEKDAEFVSVKVKDNGPGISEKEQQKVFERFYQSQNEANLHGTGIGLSLSKSLAILHHGDLKVSSEKGKGACFSLMLKLGKDHLSVEQTIFTAEARQENQIMADILKKSGENTSNVGRKREDQKQGAPKLLLVEDNYQMRKYLEEILAEYYQVISTDNGTDGFDIACSKMPDMVVSDVMMPGVDGVQLTEKLKNEVVTSHIPVILLTAKNELASYIEGIETGADDYINKPFHIDHLLVRIKNLLENRKRLRVRYERSFKDNIQELNEELSNRDHEFVNSLYQIAEQNLDNADFSSDDFSKAVFMSRTNFYKKLKALTNQTPGEFLKIYRVKRAGELLVSGGYTVSQVSLMVGFKSRSHFYQSFKKFHGKLPSDFTAPKS